MKKQFVLSGIISAVVSISTMVAAGVIGGFVMPYMAEVTEVGPIHVKIVRANGFTGQVTYEVNRARSEEGYEEFSLYPPRHVAVVYNGDCACVTNYRRKEGPHDISVHFDPKKTDTVFYTTAAVTVEDGANRPVTIGAYIPVERVQDYLGEAALIATRARERFAPVIAAN